jgi:hypothetical protein
MKTKTVVALIVLAVVTVLVYTQLTIFVIPPIGALSEGRTVIITRLNKTEFVDSPDAMCERIQGGVSLLCRGMVMAADVPPEKVAKLIERFPDRLTEGRSRDEAEAIHHRTDHWVSEGA